MGYERDSRGNDRFGGYRDRDDGQRGDYPARDRDPYGNRDYYGGNRDDHRPDGRYTQQGQGQQGYGRPHYGAHRDEDRGQPGYGRSTHSADRNRFADPERGNFDRHQPHGRGFSGQPQGYDYDDRGFIDRAGDEVRSWFGDDEAERRREMDRRHDERYGADRGFGRDEHYDGWRRKQVADLDRDYDEYRRENAHKFESEFASFRTERQTQRAALSQVKEHMEVVGSDDGHVGTVDKVRGDRIILTKTDQDAGGRHHSIPSRWIESIGDKLKIRKTADEAQAQWRDEEANQAFFKDNDGERPNRASETPAQPGAADRFPNDRLSSERSPTDRAGDTSTGNPTRGY
ncbi:DUF2171 domain-containing protein [Sphingomonas qomolangmaensis]|uniref:DUF2171 domain-containing protein n=1 Tax=Sphingomonas qomolangmaensis TaxID=2918765 RepID=A0ABY5L343_9SPHN|nr:DUF2171 domain-containing protein [Sphingomonas qomolangmaensis]UUL81369.1 DUF2171 domain-containing protein [Sphingomonas qomolangmaensis]